MNSALPDSFHPLIRSWFDERYGSATPVQREAWPRIAEGRHVLAGAPTGSGKTLTAFLDALSRYASGQLPVRGVSLLYVSPLKALNEDIRQNLLEPLRELNAYFAARGAAFPRIRVATRSGDTPQAERRRTLSDPPSILCTTPESLFILLSSKSGLALLSGLRLVVVDEIHALLGSKRGTSLSSSLGRLSLLSGEFQRIGLSATLRSFEPAARFLAGRRLIREAGGAPRYEERAVSVVAPPAEKRYELEVLWPSAPVALRNPYAGGDGDEAPSRYAAVVRDLARRMGAERGVLAFTDSRRRAEKLAAMLNEEAGEGSAWAHHGSLSKDVRRAVELRLKEGRLPCVVATSSLELGIDIGSIGLVALAGAPSRADQALQRLGRSGHGVGQSSRGLLYPFHGMDALQAAAISGAVFDKEVDELAQPESPLDMLAQIILSMLLFEARGPDALYEELLSFSSYPSLSREDFDAVIAMLSGRYADSRVKELSARIYADEDDGLLHAREGAAMLLYGAGGSIPDRGYYALRLAGNGAKLGELDEEFVFERRVGNSFSLGAQAWRITNISDEAVEVTPLGRGADFMPFWKAEKASRGRCVARRMLELCELAQRDPAAFGARLRAELAFGAEAAEALEGFLAAQKRAQKDARLPSPSSITLELHRDPDKRQDAVVAFVHTLRGLSVNEPLSIALSARIADELGLGIERLANDDSIYLLIPLSELGEARAVVERALTGLGRANALMDGLRSGLEACGAFGAAFRENAGRALLLPRSGFRKRSPLWITRLRAKRLFERVRNFPDFPLIKESWKSMLGERFDLESASALCRGLAEGSISLEVFTSIVPSPFAEGSGWAETNRYLYEGDELRAGQSGFAAASRPGSAAAGSRLRRASSAGATASAGDRAIEAALGDARLRPLIPERVYERFMRRFLREEPGWAPESLPALLDWVDERVFIPEDEWAALLKACSAELADEAARIVTEGKKLVRLRLVGSALGLVSPGRRAAALKADPAALVPDWLRSAGPVPLTRLQALFGFAADELRPLAQALHEGGSALYDEEGLAIEGRRAEPTLCDRDALDALLRSVRKASRPDMLPRPPGSLASFLALMQGLGSSRPAFGLSAALQSLSGYPLPAELWEREILPARFRATSRLCSMPYWLPALSSGSGSRPGAAARWPSARRTSGSCSASAGKAPWFGRAPCPRISGPSRPAGRAIWPALCRPYGTRPIKAPSALTASSPGACARRSGPCLSRAPQPPRPLAG
jgi:ATP-dependent helicase Lhr and Lhr-like helicase